MTALALELQPIDWATIEGALYDWLVSAVVENAIWEDQNVPQPDYPYASMKVIAGPVKEAGKDELRSSTLTGQPAGEEVELLSTSPVVMTLSISFHADPAAGALEPATRARSLAMKAQASLGKLSVIRMLDDAGLAIVREEGVTDTSLVINGEWLSRATLDVRFRTATQMTERTGYMDKVQLESPDFDVDTTVDGS
jgi:hypothetical protein